MVRALTFMTLVAWALASASPGLAQGGFAVGEKRVALVIGNALYRDQPLKNPVHDARAMATRLSALGFDVKTVENGTLEQMGRAVVDFGGRLGPGATALFFYAGHGIQSRGRNYLIPVDASIGAEGELRYQALDVTGLLEEIQQSQSRLGFVILDACRNNPFERRFRGSGQSSGLAAIDAARGMMIAYATAPGAVASDGEGENGVYTGALLRALDVPGLKAEEVFKRVRIEVVERTRSQQTPWESSSLTGEFTFNAGAAAAAPAPATALGAAPPTDREALFWYSIQASTNVADFEDYLRRFPQGDFAGLARNRIANLQQAPRVTPPPTMLQPAPAPAPQQTAAVVAPAARPPAPEIAIEPLHADYAATATARMREAPDLQAPIVGTLREGEVTLVLGKVRNRDWYQVERRGQPPAYVSIGLLEDLGLYRQRQQALAAARPQPAPANQAPAAASAPPAPALATALPAPTPPPQTASLPPAAPSTTNPYDGVWTGPFPCDYLGAKDLRVVVKDGVVTEFAAGRYRRSGVKLSPAGQFGVDFDTFQNTLLLRVAFDPRRVRFMVEGTVMYQSGETCRAELARN